MAADIMPKIGFEGEKTFRKELAEITAGTKTLASEAKAVEAAMKDETDAEKKSAAQKDILNRQILSQKEKLEKLEKGLTEAAKKFGEADVRTQKWQQAVYDGQASLSLLESKLRGTDQQVEELSDDMGDAEKATAGWADVMKGSLLADAVKSGLSWIKDTVSATAKKMMEISAAGAAYADDMLTMSTVTGLSTDTLQKYKYMAELADVSLDTVTGSLSKMTKNMSSAMKGTGDAAAAWKELGVAVADETGHMRKAEDVFNDTLTALGKIDNETERDAKAMKIFGKSAQDLNPLITADAKKLSELAKEAEDTGYVLSGSALQALGKQKDAMDRLDKKTEALKNRFAAELAPSMEKAYKVMGDTMDNPRVRRGIDVISEGVGNLIEGAANLASKVLPDLFTVFTFGDERLRLYSDEMLELVERQKAADQAHAEMMDTYKANAGTIVEETKRTESLWKELQTLVDKSGNVKEADQERVDFILNQLNEALGTEYTRNGDIIDQYKTMQEEIGNLIKKKEAELLLANAAKSFANSQAEATNQMQIAADKYGQILQEREKLIEAERKLEEEKAKARTLPGYAYQGEQYVASYTALRLKEINDIKDTISLLEKEYENAHAKGLQYAADVDRWHRAESAALQGNNEEVIRLLADQFGITLEYYARKKELNEKEKQEFRDKIESQKRLITEYERALKEGAAGITKQMIDELKDAVNQAEAIIDGKKIGEQWLDGLAAGLRDKAKVREVQQAARYSAQQIPKASKEVLLIQSPSKAAAWIGEMWDAGLIKGLEDNEESLKRAAERLSDTLTAASTPYGNALKDGVGVYNAGAVTVPIGAGGAGGASSYSTNLGGINVYVNGAEVSNAQELAHLVAVELTDELIRAQRGGRQ